jgi:hypothetical protein
MAKIIELRTHYVLICICRFVICQQYILILVLMVTFNLNLFFEVHLVLTVWHNFFSISTGQVCPELSNQRVVDALAAIMDATFRPSLLCRWESHPCPAYRGYPACRVFVSDINYFPDSSPNWLCDWFYGDRQELAESSEALSMILDRIKYWDKTFLSFIKVLIFWIFMWGTKCSKLHLFWCP